MLALSLASSLARWRCHPRTTTLLAATRQHYTRHMAKAFTCSVCHVAFKKREHLSRHIRGHTDERPFQCPECKQAFTRNDVLQRHLRSHRGNARLGERKRRGPTTQVVTSLVNNNSILTGADTTVSTSSIMTMSMPTSGIYTSLPHNGTMTTTTTPATTIPGTNSNASSFDVANQFALSPPPGPALVSSSLYAHGYPPQLYPYNNMHYQASNIGTSGHYNTSTVPSGHYIANQFEIHPPSMSTMSTMPTSAIHPYPPVNSNPNHESQDMHLLDLMNSTSGSSPSPYPYPSNSLYPDHR